MAKILINDGMHADGKTLLEQAGHEVHTTTIPQEELPTQLPGYDAIIVRSATKVREALIDQCPNLKIIARGGVGLDNIDVAYAKDKGVEVMNTPAASSASVGELAFGHFFSLARSLHHSNREMPNQGNTAFKKLKKKYSSGGTELGGKTLGVIGIGRIGQQTARIGLSLGMNVLPVDLFIKEVDININIQGVADPITVTLPSVSMEEMLAQADYIALHVPSTGKPIIGEAEFAKMKDGVFIVNPSRGGTIDEDALLVALNSGKVGGAGLDVFVNEPTPRQDLLEHPNISLTPHIGGSTKEAQRNIGLELAGKINAFFA
ncbi:MAG: D-3-phosphoglycerate dehydrogenase [Polaribacter sp.]|jgi:D-3-phosphoglycerate dehydrogenase